MVCRLQQDVSWPSTFGGFVRGRNIECNGNLQKLLSAHESQLRETSLFVGAIPNPVRNSQRMMLINTYTVYTGSHSWSNGKNPDNNERWILPGEGDYARYNFRILRTKKVQDVIDRQHLSEKSWNESSFHSFDKLWKATEKKDRRNKVGHEDL